MQKSITLSLWVGVAFSILAFSISNTLANELESETSAGSASDTEALTYNSKDASPYSWNAGYTFTHLKQSDVGGGETADDTSQLLGAFEYKKDLIYGAGLSGSTTPQEHLTSIGPNFVLGYQWKKKEGKAEEPFEPSVALRSGVAFLNFKETFSGVSVVKPGKTPKPTTGSSQILQTGWSWELEANPYEWVDAKATFTHNFYNRDVNQFLGNLNTSRAVSLGASGFANTVNGFQSNEGMLEFLFSLPEDWEINLTGNLANSASDSSITKGIQLTFARLWSDHWKTGLGYEYDNGDGIVQSLGVAQLTYIF